jgi:predicted Zn-dependent peptidase
MASEPVAENELAAAKAAMVGRLLRHTETARGSAHWYAARWRAGGLETPDERVDAIRAVTATEVLAVAARLAAGLNEMRLAFVGPDDIGEQLLSAAAAPW